MRNKGFWLLPNSPQKFLFPNFFVSVFHLKLHCQCLFICSVSKCGSSWIPLIFFPFHLYLCKRLFHISIPFMQNLIPFRYNVFTMTLINKHPLLKFLNSSYFPFKIKTQTTNVFIIKRGSS